MCKILSRVYFLNEVIFHLFVILIANTMTFDITHRPTYIVICSTMAKYISYVFRRIDPTVRMIFRNMNLFFLRTNEE